MQAPQLAKQEEPSNLLNDNLCPASAICRNKIFHIYVMKKKPIKIKTIKKMETICVIILSIFAYFAHGAYNETEFLIMPQTHTQRGAIGKGKVCPPRSVAVGFRMKIQMPEDIDEL